MALELGWIILAAVIVGLAILSYFIVKYYNDPYESRWFATLLTVIGFTLVFLTCFLIPVDIYIVSAFQDGAGHFIIDLDARNFFVTALSIIYTTIYCACLVLAFVLIPFAYFYYEEDDPDNTTCTRILHALKYTLFTIVAFVVLMVVGLVLTPDIGDDIRTHSLDWIKDLFTNNSRALHAITFCISCMGVLGLVSYILYTGIGFGGFPIGLIKGWRDVRHEREQVNSELAATRERRRHLESRYSLTPSKKMSRSDRAALEELNRRERTLLASGTQLARKDGRCTTFWRCLRPFFFIFGIVYLLFALLLITSLVITSVDKLMHSACGGLHPAVDCGYILNRPQLFNPLDKLLQLLVPVFPLDLVVLGLAIFYVFQASLSGIIRVGIRILWIRVFKIRARRTPPQPLLLACVLLMLIMLVMNVEVLTLAPQYATFGSQQYIWPNTTTLMPCSVDAGPGNCTMTAIATMVNRINLQMPFFGVIYFWGNWAFVGVFLIASLVIAIRKPPSNVDSDSDGHEELHDEDV